MNLTCSAASITPELFRAAPRRPVRYCSRAAIHVKARRPTEESASWPELLTQRPETRGLGRVVRADTRWLRGTARTYAPHRFFTFGRSCWRPALFPAHPPVLPRGCALICLRGSSIRAALWVAAPGAGAGRHGARSHCRKQCKLSLGGVAEFRHAHPRGAAQTVAETLFLRLCGGRLGRAAEQPAIQRPRIALCETGAHESSIFAVLGRDGPIQGASALA